MQAFKLKDKLASMPQKIKSAAGAMIMMGSVTEDFRHDGKKIMRRLQLHFTAGAVAIAMTLTGTASALAGGALEEEPPCQEEDVQTSVVSAVQTTSAKPAEQTVYATETWWKAGIDEYELEEFTREEIYVAEKQEETKIVYPDISFTVKSEGTGKTAAEGTVYAHSDCLTRDISEEYYTVKSIDTGAVVSGNGYDMVCRIVNGEMGSSFSSEALKAQAVAVYTYLRYCDANGLVPCVAVKSGYDKKIENAVKAVEGQICSYNGKPINAVFCASTAGSSLGSECVWMSSLPYLKSVSCSFDSADCNYGVKTSFTAAEIKRIIESKTDITLDPENVENWFEITSRSYGKYVDTIKIGGYSRCRVGGSTKKLTGAVLRASILGNRALRSTAFDISYNNGVFTFTTYGYGHGVGMSQRGAELLAVNEGLKYDQILRYYYSGIKVACSDENGVAVERYGKTEDISKLEEAVPSEEPSVTEPADNGVPAETDTTTTAAEPVVTTTKTPLETSAVTQPEETTLPPEETTVTTETTAAEPVVTEPEAVFISAETSDVSLSE